MGRIAYSGGIFVLVLFCQFHRIAATERTFERITTHDGLSEYHINGLFQDSRGFIWIGTNDGLDRFDGYEFKNYRIDPLDERSLKTNLIYDIEEDPFGNLWIGSTDNGLFRYDHDADIFEHVLKGRDEVPFQGNHVLQLHMNNNMLFAAMTEGLNCIRIEEDSYSITHITESEDTSLQLPGILDMATAGDHQTWICTNQGLLLMSIDPTGTYGFRTVPTPDNITFHTLHGVEDGIFLSAAGGTYHFNREEDFRFVSPAEATALLLDREGNLWASTNEGLIIYQRETGTAFTWSESARIRKGMEEGDISSEQITEMIQDKSGNIWVGTMHGINRYSPTRKKFRIFGEDPEEGNIWGEHIRSIYEDSKGNIWIGTDQGGLSFLDAANAGRKRFDAFVQLGPERTGDQNSGYDIEEISIGGSDYTFIGASHPALLGSFVFMGGLPYRVSLPEPFDQVEGMVFTMLQDERFLWLGTYDDGLYRYDKQSGELSRFLTESGLGLGSNIIRDLALDNSGNLWIGTGNGLNMLSAGDRQLQAPEFQLYKSDISDTCSLSHNYVLTLFVTDSGQVCAGTMGGGLNLIMGDGKFRSISTENGLPNDVIKGILEDDAGNLWLSSNRGITKFSLSDHSIINFDLYDGLQDFEFGEHACVRLSDGQMIFGGLNGYNAFYPEEIKTGSIPPDMVFTDLQVLHRTVRAGESVHGKIIIRKNINSTEKLRLSSHLNSFSIHFAALHYAAPLKNQYMYIMEGFDLDWIRTDAATTFARYTNLKPGKYTFKVMGSNNDGEWNPEPLSLQIRVIPHFWASWIAFLIYTALFILGLLFFNRFTFIRIKEKNKLLMEHFEREKIQELSQMKLQFYTNISHEFRTPLTLIIGQMQSLIKNLDSLGFEKIKQKNLIIFRNAKILLRLINQLMDFRKLEQDKMTLQARNGNLYLFLKEIYESFEELACAKSIEFTFKSFNRNIEILFDPDKIEKVFYNLLSNAFNHTKDGGKIQISIRDKSEGLVEIAVSDTGVGIPDHIKEHIFERFYQAREIRNRDVGSTGIGLALSKGLVELHKGAIEFTSKKGVGTTFFVCLPKGDAHLGENEIIKEQIEIGTGEKVSPLPSQPEPESTEDGLQVSMQEKEGKVLVVEDNLDLRSFLKENLDPDYHIQAAVDGKDALAYLQWFEPDVIICDIKMPRMDGIALCRKLKSNENTSHIPIMILTSKTSEEAQIEGYESGADAYIQKPFSIEVLKAQLKSVLRRKDEFRKDYKKDIDYALVNDSLTQLDKKLLQRTRELIEQNIMDPDYSVMKLAQDYGLSQDNLNKKLKALIGMTAKSYIRSVKLKRAARLLATGRYTVAEVTYDVGFSDLKYFRKAFKNEFDVSPSEFKSLKA